VSSTQVDVVVVGAGFAGLYASHLLTEQGLTPQGVEADDGVGGTWYWNRYPGARCDVDSLDVVALATGFDAMTGALSRVHVTGRGGRTMADALTHGLRGYLGLAIPGFPNLFTVIGPGSPSVLANVVTGIEQHVEWIVARIGEGTVFALDSCDSWYLGSNIPGKPRRLVAFIGGLGTYGDELARRTDAGYQGFTLR
jgi:cyclohexanone monooxygenase